MSLSKFYLQDQYCHDILVIVYKQLHVTCTAFLMELVVISGLGLL